MNMNKLILTFATFFLGLGAHAADWSMKSEIKDDPKTKTTYSEITFTSGKMKAVYTPSEAPLGLDFEKKFTFDKKDYFVTGWPEGAATMRFRVFEPQDKKAQMICEVTSSSEEAELKIVDGKLSISVIQDSKDKESWVSCSK